MNVDMRTSVDDGVGLELTKTLLDLITCILLTFFKPNNKWMAIQKTLIIRDDVIILGINEFPMIWCSSLEMKLNIELCKCTTYMSSRISMINPMNLLSIMTMQTPQLM